MNLLWCIVNVELYDDFALKWHVVKSHLKVEYTYSFHPSQILAAPLGVVKLILILDSLLVHWYNVLNDLEILS